MRAARLAMFAVALLGTLAATSAAAAPPGAPKGLRGFELRPNETSTHTFSRTPAFAWNPVRGASCYEFELATSRSFDGQLRLLVERVDRRRLRQVLHGRNGHAHPLRRRAAR